MIFACDHCQRRYTISDEKVRGKAVRVRCKVCSTLTTVGPLAEPEPEPALAPGEERTRMVAMDDLERLKAASHEPAGGGPWEDEPTRAVPPGEAGALWFVMLKGKQEGPFDSSALSARIYANEVQPRTYCWKNGMADWKRASEIEELAALFAPAARAPAAVRGAAPKARHVAAPPVSVTTSQILDTREVQQALAKQPRRTTAQQELDAKDLFGDLELSKVTRMPQPDLSDIARMSPPADDGGALDDAAFVTAPQPAHATQERPVTGSGGSAVRSAMRAGARPPPADGGRWKLALVPVMVVGLAIAAAYALHEFGVVRLEVPRAAAAGQARMVPVFSLDGVRALKDRLLGEPAPPPALAPASAAAPVGPQTPAAAPAPAGATAPAEPTAQGPAP